MFDIARDKAHLTPADVARLVGVHRVTVSGWFNSHAAPHSLVRRKVDKLLDAIAKAVEANDLPVPTGQRREQRAAYIAQVLHRHLVAPTHQD